MRAILALTLFLATGLRPQSEPDIFSCVEPSRIATGTLTYEYPPLAEGIGPTRGTLTLTPFRAGAQSVLRRTWIPIPNIEMVTDLNPASLAPMRFRLWSLSGGESVRQELVEGQIRDVRRTGTRVIEAGATPVVFGGPNLLESLAAAVNWDRCPSVTARYLRTDTIELATLTRTGAATLSFQGMPLTTDEISIHRSTGTGKAWVTKGAPHITMQFTRESGEVYRVISRETP